MKLQIFGVKDSFGVDRIGGTDSFYRRLARQWIERGHRVEFLTYGCDRNRKREGWYGIQVCEFVSFGAALDHLSQQGEAVLVNAIRKEHRLRFARFRSRMRGQKKFFIVYSLFKERALGRYFHFAESILCPYQNGTFCMSQRLTRALAGWVRQAVHVCPPVGREFFCAPAEKPVSNQIRLAYIGRTEPGKGIDTVVAILKRLRSDARLSLKVCGYHFPGDREAERMSDWLREQSWLSYEDRDIHSWSPEADEMLARKLAETDILLLPYARLSSSIDTPLLLLEGMAASCCVLSKPLGDIPAVYGQSPLLVEGPDFVPRAVQLIQSAAVWLDAERKRVQERAIALGFDEASVAGRVLEIITNS